VWAVGGLHRGLLQQGAHQTEGGRSENQGTKYGGRSENQGTKYHLFSLIQTLHIVYCLACGDFIAGPDKYFWWVGALILFIMHTPNTSHRDTMISTLILKMPSPKTLEMVLFVCGALYADY
jgi:hypothetical protein